jgi:hypothetical protein
VLEFRERFDRSDRTTPDARGFGLGVGDGRYGQPVSRREARTEEREAGPVLATILGGSFETLDVGVPAGTPDLAIHRAARTIVVEATRATSELHLERDPAALKQPWTDPDLLHDWSVVIQDKVTPR